jgi:hypothetical protein
LGGCEGWRGHERGRESEIRDESRGIQGAILNLSAGWLDWGAE